MSGVRPRMRGRHVPLCEIVWCTVSLYQPDILFLFFVAAEGSKGTGRPDGGGGWFRFGCTVEERASLEGAAAPLSCGGGIRVRAVQRGERGGLRGAKRAGAARGQWRPGGAELQHAPGGSGHPARAVLHYMPRCLVAAQGIFPRTSHDNEAKSQVHANICK